MSYPLVVLTSIGLLLAAGLFGLAALYRGSAKSLGTRRKALPAKRSRFVRPTPAVPQDRHVSRPSKSRQPDFGRR